MHPKDNARNISYCVNGIMCDQHINEGHDAEICAFCGSSLLIGDRYRAIALMRPFEDGQKDIYRAIDTQSGDEVVLKVINWHLNPYLRLMKVEHEFLLNAGPPFPQVSEGSYFSWAPHKDHAFYEVFVLALPLLAGTNSKKWIEENGPASEDQVIQWILQACDYLENLFEQGYIHRDIKPENFLIDESNHLTMIDFESVRKMDADYFTGIEGKRWDEGAQDYRRFTKFYSRGYSAIEELRGLPLPQSDFFSLGRTAIFWATGIDASELGNGLDSESINWSESKQELSETFIDFLQWMSAKDPGDRPVTVNLIRTFLRRDFARLRRLEWREENIGTLLRYKIFGSVVLSALFLLGVIFVSSRVFLTRGVEALEAEQSDQARKNLLISSRLNPWAGDTLYYLGLECHGRKDYDCAQENYRKSIRFSWQPAKPLYQMGVLKEALGDTESAQSFYEKSRSKFDENPEVSNRLARLAIQSGDLKKAETYIQEGLPLAVDDGMRARLLTQQGRIYVEQKKWKEAEKVLTEASELHNAAESTCLLPVVKEKLNYDPFVVDGFWYTCFFAPSQYPEGNDLKEVLVKKALPEIFSSE